MNLNVEAIKSSTFLNLNSEKEIKVIGSYHNELETLKFAEKKQPSIILIDYEIEKNNTAIFINSILNESPESKIILLGRNLSDEIIISCLMNGVFGYLDWKDVDEFLQKAIYVVINGEAWFSRRLVGLLIEKFCG